eukprot:jgi/Mesen1/7018/ME000365S06160
MATLAGPLSLALAPLYTIKNVGLQGEGLNSGANEVWLPPAYHVSGVKLGHGKRSAKRWRYAGGAIECSLQRNSNRPTAPNLHKPPQPPPLQQAQPQPSQVARQSSQFARRSLRDIPVEDLRGLVVLVRADLNVAFTKGGIKDATQIQLALPTIRHLVAAGARVLVASHWGDLKGDQVCTPEYLEGALGQPFQVAASSDAAHVGELLSGLPQGRGGVVLLPNLGCSRAELANDREQAEALGRLADVVVNDALSASHRVRMSTVGVAAHVAGARVAGLALERSLAALDSLVVHPRRPLGAVIGGKAIHVALPLLRAMVERCDVLALTGPLLHTFVAAAGARIVSPYVAHNHVAAARGLMVRAQARGVELVLPPFYCDGA